MPGGSSPRLSSLLRSAMRRMGWSRPLLLQAANAVLAEPPLSMKRRFREELEGVRVSQSFLDDVLADKLRRIKKGWRPATQDPRYYALAHALGREALGLTAEAFAEAAAAAQMEAETVGPAGIAEQGPDAVRRARAFVQRTWEALPRVRHASPSVLLALLVWVAALGNDTAARQAVMGRIGALLVARSGAPPDLGDLEDPESDGLGAAAAFDRASAALAEWQSDHDRSPLGAAVYYVADTIMALEYPEVVDLAYQHRVVSVLFELSNLPGLDGATLREVGLPRAGEA